MNLTLLLLTFLLCIVLHTQQSSAQVTCPTTEFQTFNCYYNAAMNYKWCYVELSVYTGIFNPPTPPTAGNGAEGYYDPIPGITDGWTHALSKTEWYYVYPRWNKVIEVGRAIDNQNLPLKFYTKHQCGSVSILTFQTIPSPVGFTYCFFYPACPNGVPSYQPTSIYLCNRDSKFHIDKIRPIMSAQIHTSTDLTRIQILATERDIVCMNATYTITPLILPRSISSCPIRWLKRMLIIRHGKRCLKRMSMGNRTLKVKTHINDDGEHWSCVLSFTN